MVTDQKMVTFGVTWDEFEKTMHHTHTRIILSIDEYDNLMREMGIIELCEGDYFEVHAVGNNKKWSKKYKVERVLDRDRWGNDVADWGLQEMKTKFKIMILSKKYEFKIED